MVVLAIGGSASVGKTTLSLDIARSLQLERVVHIDELRGPSFIDTTSQVWSKPAVWLHDSLIAETERLHGVIATAGRENTRGDRSLDAVELSVRRAVAGRSNPAPDV